MPDDTTRPASDRTTQLAEERTDLAVYRTRMAEERTLQAWIRTALAMISFGFTIYKFVQQLQQVVPEPGVGRPYTARNLGLALIGLGTSALIAAMVQHWQALDSLGAKPLQRPLSLAFLVAFGVALVGVLAFLGVSVHVGPF